MSAEQNAPGDFQARTQPDLDGPYKPPSGPVVATAFPFDEIEDVAERIVALPGNRAHRLEHYLKDRICRAER